MKFFSEFHKILLISIALESKIRGNNKAFLNDTVDRARLMNSNLGNNYFPSLSEVKNNYGIYLKKNKNIK